MGNTIAALVEVSRPAELASIGFRLDRRLPISEQVYDALRDAILRLRIEPRASISENALCREFGVSRTPVRAAIQRLVEDSLIKVYPNQGSFVAPINIDDMHDSHFVRRSIELALVRDVAAKWSAEKSRAGRDSVEALARTVESGDVDAFFVEDDNFHHLLAIFAERPGVYPSVVAAKTKITRFFRVSGSNPERLPFVVEEHAAVIDALDKGDVAGAEAALAYHLDKIFVMFDPLPERYRRYFAG